MKKDRDAERGVITVECAILVPVLLALLMAVLDLMSVMRLQYCLQKALTESAIYLSAESGFSTEEAASHAENAGYVGYVTDALTWEETPEQAALAVLQDRSQIRSAAGTGKIVAWFLRKMNPQTDEWLRARGVPGGLSGLDYSESVLRPDGEMLLVMRLPMGFIRNPFSGGYLFWRDMRICAATKLWEA